MIADTRVLLTRHGQSEWNALGRWQGQADPPLSDLGRRQAHEAARSLGAVDGIWASDLRRAAETAVIVGDDMGVGPVVLEPDLRERDVGEWTGLTRAEIERRYPGFLPDGRRPPGWESDELLLDRAQRTLGRIVDAAPGGDVLVITHAGVVFAVERHFGLDHTRLANVEGRWVTVARGELRLGERVLLADPEDVTVPRQT
ncbi:MAG: histidine phosphatase family protein [Acidimicrobiales bacterium]